MMNIMAICGVAVVTAVLALMLRSQSPHAAMMMSIAAGILIFLYVMNHIPDTLFGMSDMLSSSGVDPTS